MSSNWISLPENFNILKRKKEEKEEEKEKKIIILSGIILAGEVNLFPTYESTSLIKITNKEEEKEEKEVENNPPSSSSCSSSSCSSFSSSSSSIVYLQNSSLKYNLLINEVILMRFHRLLELFKQGIIQNDKENKTYYKLNQFYYYNNNKERIYLNLSYILKKVFQFILNQINNKKNLNSSYLLCLSTPMSIHVKNQIIQTLIEVNDYYIQHHSQSNENNNENNNNNNNNNNNTTKTQVHSVISSAASITISFLKTLYSPPSQLTNNTLTNALENITKLSSIRQSGIDPFYQLKNLSEYELDKDDPETTLNLLVVEVGEEYLSASIVEVENAHLFHTYEDPLYDPSDINSPSATCSIRILSTCGTYQYGWSECDQHFTEYIAKKEWKYLLNYYILNSTLPQQIITELESLETVLDYIYSQQTQQNCNSSSSSSSSSSKNYNKSLRYFTVIQTDQDIDEKNKHEFGLSIIWRDLINLISTCFSSLLKSEVDTTEASIERSLCLDTIQKTMRLYLRSYLRTYLQQERIYSLKSKLIDNILTQLIELADENMVCIRDEKIIEKNTHHSQHHSQQQQNNHYNNHNYNHNNKNQNQNQTEESEEYEVLEKLYVGYYETIKKKKRKQGKKNNSNHHTMQEMLAECIQSAINQAKTLYTEEFSHFYERPDFDEIYFNNSNYNGNNENNNNNNNNNIGIKMKRSKSKISKNKNKNKVSRGKDGWRNAYYLSPSSNEYDSDMKDSKHHTSSSSSFPSSSSKYPILPFDSVILHVECRQTKIGEQSLNNLPEENSGKGSNKVPGIREAVERVIKSILYKHQKENIIQSNYGKSSSGEILSKTLKKVGKIKSETLLPKLSTIPTVTMSTYAGALSRTQRKQSLKSHLKSSNLKKSLLKNKSCTYNYPYYFEVAVGCVWEGTCFAANECGETIRIYEAPPTFGIRVVQEDIKIPLNTSNFDNQFTIRNNNNNDNNKSDNNKSKISSTHLNRSRTESLDTFKRTTNSLINNFKNESNKKLLSKGTISSRILWLMGNIPNEAVQITNYIENDNESDNESDDEEFYLSLIDRHPASTGELNYELTSERGSYGGDSIIIGSDNNNYNNYDNNNDNNNNNNNNDEDFETRSVCSAISSSSFLSDSHHEYDNEDDEDEDDNNEHNNKLTLEDDGFNLQGINGVYFLPYQNIGGGYEEKCRVILRYYHNNYNSDLTIDSNEYDDRDIIYWSNVWRVFSLDTLPYSYFSNSNMNSYYLDEIPKTINELKDYIDKVKDLNEEKKSIELSDNVLSTIITKQSILNTIEESNRLNENSQNVSSSKSLSIRQSKSLTSLSSLSSLSINEELEFKENNNLQNETFTEVENENKIQMMIGSKEFNSIKQTIASLRSKASKKLNLTSNTSITQTSRQWSIQIIQLLNTPYGINNYSVLYSTPLPQLSTLNSLSSQPTTKTTTTNIPDHSDFLLQLFVSSNNCHCVQHFISCDLRLVPNLKYESSKSLKSCSKSDQDNDNLTKKSSSSSSTLSSSISLIFQSIFKWLYFGGWNLFLLIGCIVILFVTINYVQNKNVSNNDYNENNYNKNCLENENKIKNIKNEL